MDSKSALGIKVLVEKSLDQSCPYNRSAYIESKSASNTNTKQEFLPSCIAPESRSRSPWSSRGLDGHRPAEQPSIARILWVSTAKDKTRVLFEPVSDLFSVNGWIHCSDTSPRYSVFWATVRHRWDPNPLD
jgi:hypothetical protein